MPKSGIAESYGNSNFSFLRNRHTVFHSGYSNLHAHQQGRRVSLFSTPSPAIDICRLFNDGHSDWCEVVPHHSSDLHFSSLISDADHLFMFLAAICMSSLRNIYFGPLPIFGLHCFVVVQLHELF